MIHIGDAVKIPEKVEGKIKSRRAHFISLMVEDINRLRIGTSFPKETERMIALRLNCNPWYKNQDDEVELLYKECHSRQNYSKLYSDCPMWKKKEHSELTWLHV